MFLASEDVGKRRFGLSIVNTTKLDMFDRAQQAELFRIKALYCAALGEPFVQEAFDMFSYAVQAHPTHAKAWFGWGQFLERCVLD